MLVGLAREKAKVSEWESRKMPEMNLLICKFPLILVLELLIPRTELIYLSHLLGLPEFSIFLWFLRKTLGST